MKRFFLVTMMMTLIAAAVCFAADTRVEAPADCKHCGMNRTKFAHSRMLITYQDGSSGTCSINCAAIDFMDSGGKEVKKIQVGAYDSKKLIDAKTATWVMGGKLKGVMTALPKWAFAEKASAEKFVKKNGGRLATFAEALQAAEAEQGEKSPSGAHGGHKM
jgi:nitrous oxide reductase accessory protein NosL